MSSSSSLYKQLGLGAGSPVSPSHLLLLVVGAGFLALTVFVVHPNEFRIQSFFSGGCGRPGADAASVAVAAPPVKAVSGGTGDAAVTTARGAPADDVRVLVGIQTLPSKYERRNMLRTIYSLQAREQPSIAGSVDVWFVFCNVTSPVDEVLVALEIMRYGDIIVLDCAENMDNGKTYTFFSTVARAFNGSGGDGARTRPSYDYVMKADDDTYLRLPALVESLRGAAREDAYYGLVMPCDRENFYPFPPFMSGMGYALSWDLVQWVATAEESRRDHVGPEDMWTGRWLNLAGKAKNRYDNAPRMYNYKGSSPDSCFRHGFIPDTIAVHMLKDAGRWAETLRYFNVTAALPPSHLYHLKF